MNLFTNHTVIEGIRIVSACVINGEIKLEGYSMPRPSVESPLGMTLDFHDAQRLVGQLTEALKSMPCPTCGRTAEPAK
jgi:hypothetical protein